MGYGTDAAVSNVVRTRVAATIINMKLLNDTKYGLLLG